MKISNILKNSIDGNEKENFEINLILDNIRKGKILSIVVIGFEVVLILIDIITSILKFDSRFAFNTYFAMYSIMIIINAIYLLLIRGVDNKNEISGNQKKKLEIIIIAYITLIMAWGSIVSLMDQKLYGQLMAFMINMITCSVIYLLDNKKILVPYFLAVLILAIGLPYCQNSRDILIGHYINLFVFISISWLASRILYHNYCENYTSNILLNRSNLLLGKEIEENRKINIKLEIANNQLRELTLLDELTGIPNRRSFREFIERAFQFYVKEGSAISIIMIDIDFFKQYNDYYGHEEGDKALIAVANQITSVVDEPSEFVVRWGGEEFIYAAFSKNQEVITEKANMIRERVSDLQIPHSDSPISQNITISLGSCTIQITDKKDISKAIKLADSALYIAKNSGRNCVKTLSDEDYSMVCP